jgi:D-glycero-D-manno-heptose 1,7-bisphosphate phosphatase
MMETPSHRIRQAVFLVGGKGTRLGALTAATPKPLLEIAPGLRFLDVLLDGVARHGFEDIILLAGHLGEQVEALYQGRRIRGATVRVVREPEPAGTGGALLYAAALLDPWFVLSNGDSLFEINWRALAAPLPTDALARMALRHVPDMSRYGAIVLQGDKVTAFAEKRPDSGPGLINGGVYLLRNSVLDVIAGPCSLESDIFPRLVREGLVEGRAFDGYFLDIGLPDTYETACREIPARLIRPTAFLDRDGVLNEDRGYTHRPEDLQWVRGARETIRLLNDRGYLVIVITNQAGVARGLYDEAQVGLFHQRMQQELAALGAHIDAFYHCPYHPEAVVPAYKAVDHPERKPNPGMILRAMRDWPVRAEGSFVVGDRESDVEAGRRAGLPGYLFEGGSLLDRVAPLVAGTDATRAM